MKKVLVGIIALVFIFGFIGNVMAFSFSDFWDKLSNPSVTGYTSKNPDSDDSSGFDSGSSNGEEDKNNGKSESKSETKSESKDGKSEVKTETKFESKGGDDNSESKKVTKEEQKITLVDDQGNEIEVEVRIETKEKNGETYQKIKVRGYEVESEFEVESEEGKLKFKFSNGNKGEIKIMPDTASEIAIEKMKTKGIEVKLKEIGEGNDLSVVYEVEGNKTVKFLGLFKVNAEISAIISAENGEVLRLDEPWWYFLAFGKGAVDCGAEDLDLCDDETECTVDSGLIWYEGACILSCPIDEYICDDNETILFRDEALICEFDVSSCPILLVCDVDNFGLCLNELSCTDATGFWYNNTCNVEAEIILVCDINNLNLCLDETSCEEISVNGTWNNATNVCE